MKHSYELLQLPILMCNKRTEQAILVTDIKNHDTEGFSIEEASFGRPHKAPIKDLFLLNKELNQKQLDFIEKIIKKEEKLAVYIDVDLECKSSSNLTKAFKELNIDYIYHGETFPFSRSGKYSFLSKEKNIAETIQKLSMFEHYRIKLLDKKRVTQNNKED